MIEVKLTNFSKSENSTKKPASNSYLATETGLIVEGTSVINPSIRFKFNVVAPRYNYARIEAFDRYYFINNWTFSEGFWIASMSVDVLASFKTEIGETSAYVVRSASYFDGDIMDNRYKLSGRFDFKRITNTFQTWATSPKYGYYIINITGGGVSGSNSSTSYVFDYNNFILFINKLYAHVGSLSGSVAQGLYNSVVNPCKYINSCVWFPFPVQFGQKTSDGVLHIGLWTINGLEFWEMAGESTTYALCQFAIDKHDLTTERGNYMNFQPFTRYELVFGSTGAVPLNSEVMAHSTHLRITVFADLLTGAGIIRCEGVKNVSATKPNGDIVGYAAYINAAIGASVPLVQNGMNNTALMSAIGGAAGILTGGFEDVAGASIQAMSSGLDAMNPTVTSISNGGGFVTACVKPFLLEYFYEPVEDYDRNFGRPLNTVLQIHNLDGYVLCSDVHFSTSRATIDEVNNVKSYLESGFFYE